MPGRPFLQIPGPTLVPERIVRAMAQPVIDHRGPRFAALVQECLDGLREIFRTSLVDCQSRIPNVSEGSDEVGVQLDGDQPRGRRKIAQDGFCGAADSGPEFDDDRVVSKSPQANNSRFEEPGAGEKGSKLCGSMEKLAKERNWR